MEIEANANLFDVLVFTSTIFIGCASAGGSTTVTVQQLAAAVPADYKGPIAERPIHLPGEKWIFDSGGKYDIEFAKYEGGLGITHRTLNGKEWFIYWSPDNNVVKQANAAGEVEWENKGEYALTRFPLYVGKSWDEHYYAHGTYGRRISVHVVAYEQVTVPAGKFWAFKIEATNTCFKCLQPAYETYWYAPAVGMIVKYESREFQVYMKLIQYFKPKEVNKENK